MDNETCRPLTKDQQQRIEEKKAKALEKLQAKRDAHSAELTASDESAANQTNDRTERASKRSRWATPFYDYNLTNMEDSKAGFILDESNDKQTKKDKTPTIEPYARKSYNTHMGVLSDLSFLPLFEKARSLDPSENPTCRECKSMDLDPTFFQIFGLHDYLLTDEELRDKQILPHWSKPNPHKSTWNNMMLYVREMVEEYAFKKWDGPEGLDAEYEKREAYKKAKKDKKFKDKLADLRRRTMMSSWERKRMGGPHKHEFAPIVEDAESSTTTQTCTTCGLVIESEEF
ncbi:hypothetical protein DFQ30_010933 [Apophysomyces sp. BC1015]|nr:hypothetical protein DFQ30_010933 [Apophysomyces sp. BC1015]